MEKITIVGIVRNVEKTIEKEVQVLTKAFSANFEISYFLVESDSSDGTLQALTRLESSYKSFQIVSLGKLESVFPDRIERLSHCRNYYLHYLKKSEFHKESSFFVVADLDGANMDLKQEAVVETFKNHGWDVCTANQKTRYFDIYALRCEGWVTEDYFKELNNCLGTGMNPYRAYNKVIRDKQIHIPQDSSWIQTASSFGGLGIYRKDAFFSSTYSHLDEFGEIVCEHVPYHLALISQGFKIYINPNLVNCISSPHVFASGYLKGFFRFFLMITYDVLGVKLFNKFH